MNILALVKQVPDAETTVKIDQDSAWVRLDEPLKYRMNPFDEFAVEEAVLIKEAFPQTRVDALSVGPKRAAQVLERAMGMGADHGFHLLTSDEGYISPLTMASWIAAFASDRDYDLILTGVMAEDDMQGQVGPMLAEILDMPGATSVIREEVRPDEGLALVEREMEGGLRDCLELFLPAVLTVQSGINKPRYPSLSNLLRAKKQKSEIIDPGSLPLTAGREELVRAAYPEKTRAGLFLEGGQSEKAARLLEILKEKAFL